MIKHEHFLGRNGKKIDTFNGGKSEQEIKDYIAQMKGGEGAPSMEDMMKNMPPPPPIKKPAKKKKSKKTEL